MSQSDPLDVKTVEVEPVEEGVLVKPKRQLTEAQLANLKKGREKLAEKRRAEREQKEVQIEQKEVQIDQKEVQIDQKTPEENEKKGQSDSIQIESETQTNPESDQYEYIQCCVM
jgi:hypothetical protein